MKSLLLLSHTQLICMTSLTLCPCCALIVVNQHKRLMAFVDICESCKRFWPF
jgi:hypothetical protein